MPVPHLHHVLKHINADSLFQVDIEVMDNYQHMVPMALELPMLFPLSIFGHIDKLRIDLPAGHAQNPPKITGRNSACREYVPQTGPWFQFAWHLDGPPTLNDSMVRNVTKAIGQRLAPLAHQTFTFSGRHHLPNGVPRPLFAFMPGMLIPCRSIIIKDSAIGFEVGPRTEVNPEDWADLEELTFESCHGTLADASALVEWCRRLATASLKKLTIRNIKFTFMTPEKRLAFGRSILDLGLETKLGGVQHGCPLGMLTRLSTKGVRVLALRD